MEALLLINLFVILTLCYSVIYVYVFRSLYNYHSINHKMTKYWNKFIFISCKSFMLELKKTQQQQTNNASNDTLWNILPEKQNIKNNPMGSTPQTYMYLNKSN